MVLRKKKALWKARLRPDSSRKNDQMQEWVVCGRQVTLEPPECAVQAGPGVATERERAAESPLCS